MILFYLIAAPLFITSILTDYVLKQNNLREIALNYKIHMKTLGIPADYFPQEISMIIR
jgi:hypothetical protein